MTGSRSRVHVLKLNLSNMLLHKIISRVWDRYGLQLLTTYLKKANTYIIKCITKHINIRMWKQTYFVINLNWIHHASHLMNILTFNTCQFLHWNYVPRTQYLGPLLSILVLFFKLYLYLSACGRGFIDSSKLYRRYTFVDNISLY